MASQYRVDYASTSPRTECVNCKQVIRSGELRFMCYNTYRHVDCVTSLEVLKLWQHCKSLDSLPGMAQLDYADRQQLQTLFRTLMLSTPMHARSKMAAAAAAAAAAAEAAAAASASAASSTHSHLSHAPYREASDACMMESPPSAITLSAQSVSPPVEPLRLISSGSASNHALPQGQPTLSATPTVLAGYLSNLSCSTPTPPQHSHSLQPSGNGNGFPAHSQFPSSSSLLSPTSMSHRPLFRDVSSSSSHSSPALQSRSLAQLLPAPSLAQQGFDSRSVSPFGVAALQPLHPFPQLPHPPSPHSNQTSPVPFAHLHLHSRGNSASGSASAQTSASAGGASVQQQQQQQQGPSSLLFSSPFGAASSSTSSSSSSFHHPRSKRKLASCIPEGEESVYSSTCPAGGESAMSFSPAVSAASNPSSRADEMMDQGGEDGAGAAGGMANKKRRTRDEITPLTLAQQQQPHQPASAHMPLFFAGSLQATPPQQHPQQLHHPSRTSAHVPAL